MKWSEGLHWIAAISGIAGAVALAGAWSAGDGTFLGFSQQHLYNDAMGLFLGSIAAGIGAGYHQKEKT